MSTVPIPTHGPNEQPCPHCGKPTPITRKWTRSTEYPESMTELCTFTTYVADELTLFHECPAPGDLVAEGLEPQSLIIRLDRELGLGERASLRGRYFGQFCLDANDATHLANLLLAWARTANAALSHGKLVAKEELNADD